MEKSEDLKDLVKKAYKKLKCSVYFDKTQLLLRQQIVRFEDGNIDEELQKIYQALLGSNAEWEQLQDEILASISFKVFPKSIVGSKNKKNASRGAQDNGEDVALISNRVPDEIQIDKLQYFINMCVEGHILGVLWILVIGWKLDKDLYENSYGNRLRKLIIQELEKDNGKISYSPYLFEPYFQQYEGWRDSALELAQNSINKNQDVIVITMDLKKFFYSVDLNEDAFAEIRNRTIGQDVSEEHEINEKEIAERLNSFVEKVISKYSDCYFNEDKKRNILPIGFLPSNVLGNWCLERFDKAVSDGWNPLYFGRYVDDIIIVDKVEKNSALYKMMNEKKVNTSGVLQYCLARCSRWNGLAQAEGCDNCENCHNSKKCDNCNNKYALFIKPEEENADTKERRYILNPIYNITKKSNSDISLQNEKVKMFYFKHGESNALLQCFRKQIAENTSEFRFLPEDEAVFDANDYSEIYDIDNKESINKFRGIDGVSINKFELSKMLGKYMRVSSLINDKVENRFAQDIAKIYTAPVIIDNYITWEKVIEIFVVNGQWKALGVFMEKIFLALDHAKYVGDERENVNREEAEKQEETENQKETENREEAEKQEETENQEEGKNQEEAGNPEEGENQGEAEKKEEEERRKKEESLRKNLREYLYSAWVRALSLVWGPDVQKHIDVTVGKFSEALRDEMDVTKDRRGYLLTRMYDKYIVPVLLDVLGNKWIEKANDSEEICLYSFSAVLHESAKVKPDEAGENPVYILSPYMVTMYDLYIQNLVSKLRGTKGGKEECAGKPSSCDINSVKDRYAEVNFDIRDGIINNAIHAAEADINGNQEVSVISVGSVQQGKLDIAIANIRLDVANFERLVKENPNRSYKRYEDLSRIVNSAISEKADMLVLPEACVPIEWLPTLIRTCTKNNMALVTGVEHIIFNESVYNYTAVALPYEEAGYRCAVLSFHLKNHYAPHEVDLIRGYRLQEVPGKGYELYHWKDCWFPVYCCYELASIGDRALFSAYADVLVAVEWNRDVNYYSNILESLSRDLHCYCVQVNSSDYGDSRITMPSKTDVKDIIKSKGGNNATVLVGTVDFKKLRNFQLKEYNLQKMNKEYKPTPPVFDKKIIKQKIQRKLEDELVKKGKKSDGTQKE